MVADVDHEERGRQAAHVGDAAEVLLHARHLALDGRFFLAGELGQFARGLHRLVLLELGHGLLDGLVIRERATEPAINAHRHVGRGRGFADQVLRLALRADEQHVATAGDLLLEKLTGLGQRLMRLAEVDDGDPLAVVENEGLRARIPALGLVAEVNTCVEQVLGSNADGHGSDVSYDTQVGQWAALRSSDGYGF